MILNTIVYENSTGSAAEVIRSGGLCAVPTETVYGIACNALDAAAVEHIYELKGRPAVKPLSIMVPGAEAMETYCRDVPSQAKLLAAEFWPGPLTIVLEAKTELIPSIVLAGGHTVGLRCPANELTLAALNASGVPFAAPSANPSGKPSPKTAGEVLDYFNGQIEAVIDGGECTLGTESTIISLAEKPYRILRLGALGEDEIRRCLVSGLSVVGISCGTGCGKTTALQSLNDSGALLIDCDEVYHRLLKDCREMISEISASFPDAVSDGSVDTKLLGKTVFINPDALKLLNRITHGYVCTEVNRMLSDFAMSGGRLALIDAVELFSSGLSEICDFTVGITAPFEERIRRIMKRDGISREYAVSRINAQRSDGYYASNCTYMIENSSDEESFISAFSELIKGGLENGTI